MKKRTKRFAAFLALVIDSIIDGTHTEYKDQISSLIGENVQLYDDLVPLCENTFVSGKPENQDAA